MKIYAVNILGISEEILNKMCLLLDSEKKCKIEKIKNINDKVRTLIGDILIRTIIAKEFNISNKKLKIEKNQYGKPYLKEYQEFNFNISHSGDFVVCAIDNKPIGIDIEEIKHIEFEQIAKRFFTLSEFDYINNNISNSRLSKFYEIWTLKESYIKCCGKGLAIPLNSFSINISNFGDIKLIINNEGQEHTFKRFDIAAGYNMSVCSLNNEISNNIIWIDYNSLVTDFCHINNGII